MKKLSLSVVMATFDDFNGVYFTIQSIRKDHRHLFDRLQFVVVDNNPNSAEGKMTASFMHKLANSGFGAKHAKYVSFSEAVGTSAPRDLAIRSADNDFAMCIDSHVLLWPQAIDNTLKYLEENPGCDNLLQGPLIYDDVRGDAVSTHFNDVWRAEMWGTWGTAWECKCGENMIAMQEQKGMAVATRLMNCKTRFFGCSKCGCDAPQNLPWSAHEARLRQAGFKLASDGTEPFEIPGQGLGLFCTRRQSWLGFHPKARGFGGEELYIHGKYRQAGRKTLCLPWLKWIHRFGRPSGTKYTLTRWHKIRNYVLEFQELGWPLDPIYNHFVSRKHPGETIQEHLEREHAVHPQSYKDVTDPEKIKLLHERFKISEYSWSLILAGKEYQESQELEKQERVREEEVGCHSCGGNAAPANLSAEEWFAKAAGNPSDISEHVPTLRQLAAEADHVAVFGGHHGISTIAILAAHPAALDVFDRAISNEMAAIKKAAETDEFKKAGRATEVRLFTGDTRTIPVAECDLLFIDTHHVADYLLAELRNAAPKVTKRIVMHDTEIFGEKGSDGGPGLLPALRLFMRQHPEWSVIKHYRNNHGLTVISRDPADKKSLPGMIRMAWNYTKAIAKHKLSGSKIASEEVVQSRLDICATCEHRVDNRCTICGCYLDEGPDGKEGKSLWSESECPIGRWPLSFAK